MICFQVKILIHLGVNVNEVWDWYPPSPADCSLVTRSIHRAPEYTASFHCQLELRKWSPPPSLFLNSRGTWFLGNIWYCWWLPPPRGPDHPCTFLPSPAWSHVRRRPLSRLQVSLLLAGLAWPSPSLPLPSWRGSRLWSTCPPRADALSSGLSPELPHLQVPTSSSIWTPRQALLSQLMQRGHHRLASQPSFVFSSGTVRSTRAAVGFTPSSLHPGHWCLVLLVRYQLEWPEGQGNPPLATRPDTGLLLPSVTPAADFEAADRLPSLLGGRTPAAASCSGLPSRPPFLQPILLPIGREVLPTVNLGNSGCYNLNPQSL